jgi:hypothetical protein
VPRGEGGCGGGGGRECAGVGEGECGGGGRESGGAGGRGGVRGWGKSASQDSSSRGMELQQ